MRGIRGMRAIVREREALAAQIAPLNTALAALAEKQFALIKTGVRLKCRECGKTSPLGTWDFMRDHWYIQPHGCTDGDYWKAHEVQTCYIVCPHCRKMNYIYNHPMRDQLIGLSKQFDFRFTSLFAQVWDKYGNEAAKLREPKSFND